MARKQREALAFVRKTSGAKDILFAVVGMPERTTAPKETAHYILFSGNKCKRYKMKINTCEIEKIKKEVPYNPEDKNSNMKIITELHVKSCTPNFEEVTGTELTEMYNKCCPAFKETFKI